MKVNNLVLDEYDHYVPNPELICLGGPLFKAVECQHNTVTQSRL